MAVASPPTDAVATSRGTDVLARLPLQIGTTSAWSAGRSAAALFPGFALVAVTIYLAVHITTYDIRLVAAVGAVAVMLILYAVGHLRTAVRTRASDVLLLGDGLSVDGGELHGARVGWSELTPPYAEIEDTTVRRITMVNILWLVLTILAKKNMGGEATSAVQVWRLHLHQGGARRLIAETDRPIERDSMAAAAASVSAVVTGQRYVAEAPTIAARMLTCGGCGAAAVPDDTASVTCTYCNAKVQVSPDIRAQAAASKTLSSSRGTTTAMIAKLREQPRAAQTNVWLLVLTVLMFGAWPLGWGLIAFRVLADGFQLPDLFCLLLPFAAVVSGFFLARARLADRGALQLLTLGFGALSPERHGQPSRCRRCLGPLPDAGIGGVAQCRYCAAENIVGLDLRPTVDSARTEQATFDVALKKRAEERRLWTTLTAVAALVLVGWAVGTVAYIVHIAGNGRAAPAHETPTKTHAKPAAPAPPKRGR